jgi:hypothetical protein
MISAKPFAGVERRVAFLRATLLAALFLGLLASAPAWLNARSYPLLPIASWFPILPAPGDVALFGAMLFALLVAPWRYRESVIFFLGAAVFAWAQDQNRGQPWFYLYWAMLMMSLFPAATALAACRWAVTAVYFWGGIQKCNARFFEVVPKWFVEPMTQWPVPDFVVTIMRGGVWASPFIEIAIAVALWIPVLRRPALVMITALHVLAVLLLGPLGHDYNWVVWPWNLAMVALAWTLFTKSSFWREPTTGTPAPAPASAKRDKRTPRIAARDALSLAQSVTALRQSRAALVLVSLFTLLPILSFKGRWDSGFSFSLYSENQAVANVFVTQAFADRLPERLKPYVQPYATEFDPMHQGPLLFAFQAWCFEELHVPPLPEPRAYRAVFNHLCAYAVEPADVRMIIGTRGGPVLFLEGEREEQLQRR